MVITCFASASFDEIEEPVFAKKYQHVFNSDISEFVSSELLNRKIEKEFANKLTALDCQDKCYEARKSSLEAQKMKELDSVF